MSQIKLSISSSQKLTPNFSLLYPRIRTYIPSCNYKFRLSSPSLCTSLSSDLVCHQSSGISEFSCRLPERSNGVGKTFCSAAVYTSSYDEDLTKAPLHVAEEKIGVLLLNLGGPETLNDVQPFLYNLFADPDIIRLPMLFRFLQRPLAQLISMFRASKSKEAYASIGGGSPLRKITDEQAKAVKLALEAKNKNVSVYVAMRYWFPFTEEAVQQIKKDKITKLVVLPLYPQFSISTTGSSLQVLQDMFRKDAYLSRLPCAIIRSWYQREGYVKSMADLIEKELHSFSLPDECSWCAS